MPDTSVGALADRTLRSAIEQFWQRFGANRQQFAVAISGGIDSSVLAHACAHFAHRHGLRLTLLHVDHALFDNSDGWTRHCSELAGALGVAFRGCRINVNLRAGFGLEGSARLARYRAIADLLQDDETRIDNAKNALVLTAHQLEDQAETIMLRLLRGTGTAGLAGMAPLRAHVLDGQVRYWLGRPLLSVSRAQIEQYANQHALRWLEDPLNERMQAPRNRLRKQVLPQLRQMAPHLDSNLLRIADQARQENQLLNQLAVQALARCIGSTPLVVDVKKLQAEPAALHARILQHWLTAFVMPKRALEGLPEHAVRRALVLARQHTESGEVALSEHRVLRRYRHNLHAAMRESPALHRLRANFLQSWSISPLHYAPLDLPGGMQLKLTMPPTRALQLHVFFPGRCAYQIRPAGRGLSKAVRILLQEQAVPPWQRLALPLISLQPEATRIELDAVVGIAQSQALQDALGAAQIQLITSNAWL